MRSPLQAIAWEIWAGHRLNWLIIFAATVGFALLSLLFPEAAHKSEALKTAGCLLAVFLLCLMMAAFNFTEVNPRKGFAGYPQRLFAMPIPTWLLVAVPMLCGVVSVVLAYVAWAKLVFPLAGIALLVRWPAILLATAMIFYQTIVWCLSGFRITRLFVLGFVLTALVGVGFIPFMNAMTNIVTAQGNNTNRVVSRLGIYGTLSEGQLSAILAGLMLTAYVASVLVIGQQRRGAAQGLLWRRILSQLNDVIPHWQWNLSSADRALWWIQWRRSGWVLPIVVLFTLLMIIGPVSWTVGNGGNATARSVGWISILPMLLALLVGQGMAKPDFWSLELLLPTFLSTRPISGGQILGAKLKSAAVSTLLTWAIVLTVTPLWVRCYGNTDQLQNLWATFRTIYCPFSQWAIPPLVLLTAVLLTWSFLVSSIWRGSSGRIWFFYTMVSFSIAGFVACLFFFTWLFDPDREQQDFLVSVIHWLPWLLALAVIAKCWITYWAARKAKNCCLVSQRSLRLYGYGWLATTACLAALAWLLAPDVGWVRYLLLLSALLAVPTARIASAPLAIAWNRHR